jgi:hypothetical protein
LVVDLLLLISCVLEVKISNTKSVILTLESCVGSRYAVIEVIDGVDEVVSVGVELIEGILLNWELCFECENVVLGGCNLSIDIISLVE